jgi:hypothetical protein
VHSAPALSWSTIGKALLTLVLGAVVGVMGTVMHRSIQPWGLVLSLLLVLAAAVTARAFGGLVAWIGYALGLGAAVLTLSQTGPGGDVLVPAGQKIGLVWLVGAGVVAVVGMLLPPRWFSDAPLPARPREPALTADVGGEPDVPQ